eukprot:15338664-Ditylum_brightwellii.AAC.1
MHHLIPWGYVIYHRTHSPKDLEARHDEGYYTGITNSSSLIEWWDQKTGKVKQCNTAWFHEFRTHLGDNKPVSDIFDIGGTSLADSDSIPIELNTSDHLYSEGTPEMFTVPLSPNGRSISIEI